MRAIHWLATTSFAAIAVPAAAQAQTASATELVNADMREVTPQPSPAAQTRTAPDAMPADQGDIVVTARRREESLKDVPIAVTAITGASIKEHQLNTVKDIAAYTPGLVINSDSVGRAFVSIRGIGTTLIDTVQPGVGIFIDGIYQPDTTYLMSPLTDVERVEVLRGPQGTLFGNNTLGGAINVITRQPSNDWEFRLDGALATGDNYGSVSGSVSGPIVHDLLQFRIGAAYHTQDGFEYNTLAYGNQNPLETKTVSGTLRFTPADWATITANGNWDHVFGGSTPYFYSSGPRDYSLTGQTNELSLADIDYYAANVKGEFDVHSLHTKITAVAAYNESDSHGTGDGDFGPVDYLRADVTRLTKTRTGELRFDTTWNSHISTLIGAFIDHSTNDYETITIVPLAGLSVPSSEVAINDSQAVFGTAFFKFTSSLELSTGLRYDHQKLNASTAGAPAAYEANEWQPRVTLTKHWTPDFMTYASVARGVRGGGQNGPGAPNLIYKGDSVWTYEAGTKIEGMAHRLSLDFDVFYNDYSDFIGPNALVPSTSGAGFIAVNLNAGHADSYGVEAQGSFSVTPDWQLYGNATLMRARVTNSAEFEATTGYAYPGDRIPFVPDWTFNAGTHVTQPIGNDQSLFLDANVIGKGTRTGVSLDASSIPVLSSYYLVNGSLGWKHKGFEVALFATNLFNEKYIESYLDKSDLGRAGLPAPLVQNLVIQGDRRRVGLRTSIQF